MRESSVFVIFFFLHFVGVWRTCPCGRWKRGFIGKPRRNGSQIRFCVYFEQVYGILSAERFSEKRQWFMAISTRYNVHFFIPWPVINRHVHAIVSITCTIIGTSQLTIMFNSDSHFLFLHWDGVGRLPFLVPFPYL